MNINKIAMGLLMVSSSLIGSGAAFAVEIPISVVSQSPINKDSSYQDYWWEKYSNQRAFTEALTHINTSLDRLNSDPAKTLSDSADSRTPLYWLQRTMKMYPLTSPNSYYMPVAHHETKDWINGLYGTTGRGIFYLTRTLGSVGQTININAAQIPAGASCYAATGNDFSDPDKMYRDQVKLTSGGDTSYTFKSKGVLFLGCGDPDKQQNDTFVHLTVSGGENSHLFILGQAIQDDWSASKKVAESIGSALLFDGISNIVVPEKKALATNENIGQVLGHSLRTLALYEKINGMDGSETMFKSSQGSMFSNYGLCCSAAYRNGFITVGFFERAMLDEKSELGNWGLWHEMGHAYEPTREAITLFSEIQVNRYSLEACRMFNGDTDVAPSKCHVDMSDYPNWDPNAVKNFLSSNIYYDDYEKIQDRHWEPLKFFAYLRFSYGDNFFPKVNQARLKAVYAAPGQTMADKYYAIMGTKNSLIDFSVFAYSQAAGQDLRNYFSRWGMKFSDAASKKVADLNLPQPGENEGLPIVVKATTSASEVIGAGTVELSATVSNNPGQLRYQWKAISGSGVRFSNANAAKTTATFPEVTQETVYTFEVTVTDENATQQSSDRVQVKQKSEEIIGSVEEWKSTTYLGGSRVCYQKGLFEAKWYAGPNDKPDLNGPTNSSQPGWAGQPWLLIEKDSSSCR